MRQSLLALSIAALLAGCNPASQAPEQTTSQPAAPQAAAPAVVAEQNETERLNKWFEAKYEEQLQMSPLQLTFLGRKEKNALKEELIQMLLPRAFSRSSVTTALYDEQNQWFIVNSSSAGRAEEVLSHLDEFGLVEYEWIYIDRNKGLNPVSSGKKKLL